MGLGKSLGVISLLATDWQQPFNEASKLAPTLVVVLPSLLGTWENELRKHLHPDTLRCLLYHGPKRSNDVHSMLAHDMVLTTYDMVATEWKNLDMGSRPLFSVTWRRIVLDEGKSLLLIRHAC